jgi:hypothetical protein
LHPLEWQLASLHGQKLPLDSRQKWGMASRRSNIEVAGIATIVLSVAALAVVLLAG